MSETKSEVIAAIMPLLRLTKAEQDKMRSGLETSTLSELNMLFSIVSGRKYQDDLDDEEILQVQAERAADAAMFLLERDRQTAPQRTREAKAQLELDQHTFAALCRQFGLSECDANFSLWQESRSIEGLAQASPQESAKFSEEKIENHNDALLKMDPVQLRAQVRQEATDTRVQQAQAEIDRQIEAIRIKDAPFDYPTLPTEFTKDGLLQLVQQDTKKYRFLIQKFGNYNVTARLQGRA